MAWHIKHDGKEIGPITTAQLKHLVASGQINRQTPVRSDESDWSVAGNVSGLFPVETVQDVAMEPPLPPPRPTPEPPRAVACNFCSEQILATAIKCKHCGEFLNEAPASKKKILPIVILLFAGGTLGFHALYAGRAMQGVVYPLLSIMALIFTQAPDPLHLISFVIVMLVALLLLGDLVRLSAGTYKDGDGNLVTRWI